MNADTYVVISAILGSNLLTGLVTMFMSKRKNNAESTNIIADTYIDLVKELRNEVDRLTDKVHNVEVELAACVGKSLEEMNKLRDRIRACEINHHEISSKPPVTIKTTVT